MNNRTIEDYHGTIFGDVMFDILNDELEKYEKAYDSKHCENEEVVRCIVKGCIESVKNSCKICIFHHPIQKAEDYPCYLE